MANQYTNKVIVNGQAIIDLTGDTVTAAHLHSGFTAHDKSGKPITGYAVIPTGSTTVTANGSYSVTQYETVVVSIPTYNGEVI